MTMKMKMIDLYAFLGIIKNDDDDGWIWVFLGWWKMNMISGFLGNYGSEIWWMNWIFMDDERWR